MKIKGKTLPCLFGGLLLCQGTKVMASDAASNPYGRIVYRNAFGLLPATPQIPEPPPRPVAKIKLTGITSIFGDRRALLIAQLPAASSEPPIAISLILAEGQASGQIKVLEINEKLDEAKVDNYGTVVVLNFNVQGTTADSSSGKPGHEIVR